MLEATVQVELVPPLVMSTVLEKPVTGSEKVAVTENEERDAWEPAGGSEVRATVGAVVSTVIDSGAAVVDTFPAASVSATVMLQLPSLNVPSVHAPALTVHVTLTPSFVAVTTAVPVTPATLTVGVLSFVMSSELLEPESDGAARSGVRAAVGVVSTVTGRPAVADDTVVPTACTAEMVQLPSTSVPRSHEPDVPVATKLHDTSADPAFCAVTVTLAPASVPVTVMFGVSSFVVSSVEEEPVSEEVVRSTPVGDATPTSPVAADTEVTLPLAFDAVAAKRRYEPASSAVTV